jgi:hypothetical protein
MMQFWEAKRKENSRESDLVIASTFVSLKLTFSFHFSTFLEGGSQHQQHLKELGKFFTKNLKKSFVDTNN